MSLIKKSLDPELKTKVHESVPSDDAAELDLNELDGVAGGMHIVPLLREETEQGDGANNNGDESYALNRRQYGAVL